MKIVVEYVLLENFLINLIILKSCELILKEKGRLFWLSALIGGVVTLLIPILSLTAVGAILLQGAVSIIYVCISFRFRTLKKFALVYVCFYVSTFLYGGVCSFVQSYVGGEPFLAILLTVVAMYFVLRLLFNRLFKKRQIQNFCVEVEIENEQVSCKWNAFLDSGNLLIDPLTKKPVSLVNFRAFSAIFKDVELEDVLRKSQKLMTLKMAHYISFGTIGEGAKMLVFEVDCLSIGSKKCEKAMLGLSLKNFNQAFGTDVILHNNMASLCV